MVEKEANGILRRNQHVRAELRSRSSNLSFALESAAYRIGHLPGEPRPPEQPDGYATFFAHPREHAEVFIAVGCKSCTPSSLPLSAIRKPASSASPTCCA